MNNRFKEEVRDGYLVDEKHKRIWAIEMKLLSEIIRICDKYKLSWFAYGGTLLGAVRHKGFIPWDDDMDIAMLRKDYEVFLEKAEEELDKDLFCLQKSEEFGEIYEGFARIRDNHSTALIYRDRNKKVNHGIFIDIFPLDNIPDDKNKQKKQCTKIRLLSGLVFYRTYSAGELRHKALGKMLRKLGGPRIWERIVKRLKKECMKYNTIRTEKVGILSCDPYDEKCYWYYDDISCTIDMEFEDIEVKVPVGYDRCLKIGYGDYFILPPVEERGNWHNHVFFDPYKPYSFYEGREDLFDQS